MTDRVLGIPEAEFVVDRFENVRGNDIPGYIKAVGVGVDGVLRFHHDDWLNGTIEKALTDVAESRPTYLVANLYGKKQEGKLPEIFKRVPLRGILTPSIVAMPGSKPSTAGKPNPAMLQYIIDIEDIEPNELLVFDDQISSGVEAAARIGAESALLPRLGRLDHPGVRILRRGPETLARLALSMPVHAHNFPDHLVTLEGWRRDEEEKRRQRREERKQKRTSPEKHDPEQLVQ